MNYAEFETFSDSSSENNKKQNHGNYISWTSSEDAILVEQVKKYLENKNIQNENVPNENAKENTDVNNQINNFINNENNENNNINLNKEKNLAEKNGEKNDKKDKEINNILNINWAKISEKFENKNARQCQTRWQNILDPNRVKGPWTKEEDLKLIELVKKFGPEKWSNISTYLPGRLGKQCRERWYNHLNPEVRKTGWSKEEEWALFLLHRKYGNSWSTFSGKIPGRTDNTIKNHWNSIMKKNIVSINNQYQEMIKGKSKDEIEQIEKKIMDKCNQVMNKDYNEYYQEKLKEFPMMKSTKFGKKSKEKNNEENNISNDNTVNMGENDKENIINENKKTPDKIKKKIFENIKVSRDLNKNSKNKNKSHEKNENSKETKHKNSKKNNSAKKSNKYLDINDEKEMRILKSGEKILQKDKNILIKEAENKLKEKQKLKKDERKSKLLKSNQLKLDENEDSVKSIDNLPTYQNKKSAKKHKKKLGRPKKFGSNKKNRTKFNVSKYSSNNKVKDSPSINNININQKISFQNTFINTNFNNNNQMNPNQMFNNNDYMKNNNMNMPFPMYPNEKYYYTDEDKDYNKMNFNKILITDSKDLNKAKKDAQFPFKVPPTGPFYRSDIKNSSESSGGNNSLGRITPDFRMNPPFIPSNDKYYLMPQNAPLFYNSNPNNIRYIKGNNNNNNNKISTDSNSIHSYSMNQSMISANSAFKKSSSGSGSGSGRSFQPRANVFNFNNMADLNKEYFSNINLDEKNFK